MSPEDFARLALSLPETLQGAHLGTTDFRVGGKIFATMGHPDADWAMVKLTPDQQAVLCEAEPEIFRPVKGGWGLKGATNVRIETADEVSVTGALRLAWVNTAPSRLRPLLA